MSLKHSLALLAALTAGTAITAPTFAQDSHGSTVDTHATTTEAVDSTLEQHHADAAHALATADHADAHGAHADHDANTDLLKFDVTAYVTALTVFAIFFGVLAVVVWPQILKGLKAREEKIRSDLAAAERAAKQAASVEGELQAKLSAASAQAQKIVADAQAAAVAVAAQIKAEAQKSAADQLERATREISAAREAAVAEVATVAGELATDIATKVLRREISATDQANLVKEALAQLSSR
jgi:F-type H+-transporting ATPase subunit b